MSTIWHDDALSSRREACQPHLKVVHPSPLIGFEISGAEAASLVNVDRRSGRIVGHPEAIRISDKSANRRVKTTAAEAVQEVSFGGTAAARLDVSFR